MGSQRARGGICRVRSNKTPCSSRLTHVDNVQGRQCLTYKLLYKCTRYSEMPELEYEKAFDAAVFGYSGAAAASDRELLPTLVPHYARTRPLCHLGWGNNWPKLGTRMR